MPTTYSAVITSSSEIQAVPNNNFSGDWAEGPYVDTQFSYIGSGNGSGPGQDAGGGQDFVDPGWQENLVIAEVIADYVEPCA